METNLAVLIDFENIAAGTEKEGLGRFDVESLMQRVKDKGRILVARSYADWGRFSRFKQSLLTSNVTMMELTSHGMQDKNRADIAMVVDCLELAFTRPYIDTFVVVSGDSDFTPLVLKMRELNKRVLGIGTRKSTSRLLIQACDEFLFYDSVVQPKLKRRAPPARAGQSSDLAQAFEMLEVALDGLQRENPDPPLASIVKTAMLRKMPDFNESDLGFPSFARFLETAQEARVVRVVRDTKSGGYKVDTWAEGRGPDAVAPREDEPVSDWVDSYLPKGASAFTDVLNKANLHPVAASTRLAMLEALVEVVDERTKRRRKTTVQFVRDDVKKKLRRTHPDLPMKSLKGMLDGLLQAGELIHRDGTAIRSGTAPFILVKEPDALNEALVQLYLSYLRNAKVDLDDTSLLSDLMYGDVARRREIEETLAYLATEAADTTDNGDNGDHSDVHTLDDLDLDDLLIAGGDRVAVREPVNGKAVSKAANKTVSKAPDALPEPDADAVLEEEAEKKPRRRTRKKKEDTETETAVEAAPAEEAPKKKPTRSRKKKAEPEDLEMSDLDSLLEPQP